MGDRTLPPYRVPGKEQRGGQGQGCDALDHYSNGYLSYCDEHETGGQQDQNCDSGPEYDSSVVHRYRPLLAAGQASS